MALPGLIKTVEVVSVVPVYGGGVGKSVVVIGVSSVTLFVKVGSGPGVAYGVVAVTVGSGTGAGLGGSG